MSAAASKCYLCQQVRPPVQHINITAGAAGGTPSVFKPICAECAAQRSPLITHDALAARVADAEAAGFRRGVEAAAEKVRRYLPRGHEGLDGSYNRGINTGAMHARSDLERDILALLPGEAPR